MPATRSSSSCCAASERIEKTIELVGKLSRTRSRSSAPCRCGSPATSRAGRDAALRLSRQPGGQGRPQAGRSHHGRGTASRSRSSTSCSSNWPRSRPGKRSKFEILRGGETLTLEPSWPRCPEAIPGDLPPAHDQPPPPKVPKPAVGTRRRSRFPSRNRRASPMCRRITTPSWPMAWCVWLHAPGGYKDDELVARWKTDLREARSDPVRPKERRPGQVAADRAGLHPQDARRCHAQVSCRSRAHRRRRARRGRRDGISVALWQTASSPRGRGHRRLAADRDADSAERSDAAAWRSSSASPKKTRSNRRSGRPRPSSAAKNTPSPCKDIGPALRDRSPPTRLAEWLRWIDSLDRI